MEIHNLVPIPTKTWHFKILGEPEILHVIKSGYSNAYIVLWEDGYDLAGDCKFELMSKEKIESFYKIEIK